MLWADRSFAVLSNPLVAATEAPTFQRLEVPGRGQGPGMKGHPPFDPLLVRGGQKIRGQKRTRLVFDACLRIIGVRKHVFSTSHWARFEAAPAMSAKAIPRQRLARDSRNGRHLLAVASKLKQSLRGHRRFKPRLRALSRRETGRAKSGVEFHRWTLGLFFCLAAC